jgi:hypothetical protein
VPGYDDVATFSYAIGNFGETEIGALDVLNHLSNVARGAAIAFTGWTEL